MKLRLVSLASLTSAFVLVPNPQQRHGLGVKEDVVGVDIWGDPVTAADMVPIAPVEEVPTPVKKYTVKDFAGSEWKIGIYWRDDDKLEVTWFRIQGDGTSQWGFGFDASGKWKMDDGVFITFTREFLLGWNGRRLFSAKIGDDPNYLEGVVRGWKPWEPASIMGTWQAIRLGVDRPRPAPWLLDDDDPDDPDVADEQQPLLLRADDSSRDLHDDLGSSPDDLDDDDDVALSSSSSPLDVALQDEEGDPEDDNDDEDEKIRSTNLKLDP